MKKIGFILSFIVLLISCNLTSCHKVGDPVKQIIDLFDNATEKIKNIEDINQLYVVGNMVSQKELMEIIDKNKDYPLTETDKKALIKSYSHLVQETFNKISTFEPSESMKKSVEAEKDAILAGIKNDMGKATFLGDLKLAI